MSKKNLYILIICFCPLAISLAAYYHARRAVIKLDGFSGELWMLIAPPETRYARGYTHEKFAMVQVGMTEHEVLQLLGEPQSRWWPYRYTRFHSKAHYVGLQYSCSPNSTHYRLRQVYLDNGVVAEVISYFYLD